MCLDLVGPVRQEILTELKAAGRATAEELGNLCFLSAGATRQHLVSLEAEGLVEHEIERHGPGRPRHFYILTTRGNQLFTQGYVHLCSTLLDVLGDAPVELQDRARQLFRTCFMPAPPASGAVIALEDLVAGLDARGFLPRSTSSDHTIDLTLGHCPVWQVAQRHRVLCEMEKQLLLEVLGASSVERLSHTLAGEYRCLYRLTFGEPPENEECECGT